MPTIKRKLTAASDDALANLQFATQGAPALVSLFASTATEGEACTFTVGNRQYAVEAEANLEAASGVVDTDRDQILFQEAVPPGRYHLQVPAVTATFQYILAIEPVV